jgi:hypothetical protein
MRSVSPLVLTSLLGALCACAPEGSSAYVSYNVLLDDKCEADETAGPLAIGRYDVGAASSKADCVHSYFMSLLVNSNLKMNAQDSTGRAEPDVLQITHADIRLMDKNQATLPFLKGGTGADAKSADPTRPNPYRVETSTSLSPSTGTAPGIGIAPIEAIPKAYASALTKYDGDSVLLEIQLFGTTTGDIDIDFRSFLYPVSICRGCMSMCLSEGATDSTDAPILNQCADNRAQDGFWCIDTKC